MKKGDIIENITVEKLVFGGKGFAKLKSDNPDLDGRTIFITGGCIPGSIVNLRVIKKRRDYIDTQIASVVKTSPLELKHPQNPYGECGGCKWVNIPYEEQLKIKANQVREAFFHVEKSLLPRLGKEGLGVVFQPIIPSPLVDGYRNKVEFSFGKYISAKEGREEHFNVGFHKQGSFSQIQDYEGCILIDDELNNIYLDIKNHCKGSGLPVFDQKPQTGFFRHILLRKGCFTNEIMIIFSFNPAYFGDQQEKEHELTILKKYFQDLAKRYPSIASIYLSHNTNKADIAIGELENIYGKKYITETLLGLTFNISPKSFFQTNSYGAEKLYQKVLEVAGYHSELACPENSVNSESGKGKHTDIDPVTGTGGHRPDFNNHVIPAPCPVLAGKVGIYNGSISKSIEDMTILDLYGGTGTIGMLFAHAGAKKVISVEMVASASKDGKENATLNKLSNIEFKNAKVEEYLEEYLTPPLTHPDQGGGEADILVIDPPRAGMHPKALPDILKFKTKQIIYVSCNPSTLARDLDYILKNSNYQIESITPVDMFPHTHHIETVVSLIRNI